MKDELSNTGTGTASQLLLHRQVRRRYRASKKWADLPGVIEMLAISDMMA